MYPSASRAMVISLLAGFANTAALEDRAPAVTCSTNSLAKLMVAFSGYAVPYCAAVRISPSTPVVTITAAPTVTVSATLTSIKTVTAAGTTTVVVNAKRDTTLDTAEKRSGQLEDRALDFAMIALLAGQNLAVTSVSTACSCFSSSYTAPTVTTTVPGKSTVTVAVAKATTIITTTVQAVTVTSKNAAFVPASSAPTMSLSFVSPSSASSSPTSSAKQSVISTVAIVSSSFVPLGSITNSAELASLTSAISAALTGSATLDGAIASATSSVPAGISEPNLPSTGNSSITGNSTSTACGVGLQPYNSANFTLPSTYNGCNPTSKTGFSACHSIIGGSAVCSSCGKCSTTVCLKDADCASGSACIINSACSATGTAVCLQLSERCYA